MKKYFITLNVIVPLLIGAAIYYVISPNTLFVKFIDSHLEIAYHATVNTDNIMIKIIRFYLLDFLWAYALMNSATLFFELTKRTIMIIISFEVMMELIQLLPSIKGTFDVCDIGVEIFANILVILLSRRKYKNEKI